MQGVYSLDGPIHANRFADSRESSRGSRTEPLFHESRFGALKVANHGFEVIRANRSNVIKIAGWSRMSGRRTSGTSRPSLGVQVLAVIAFNF